jgi:hypothetical protein
MSCLPIVDEGANDATTYIFSSKYTNSKESS